jgi:hypothetical protein
MVDRLITCQDQGRAAAASQDAPPSEPRPVSPGLLPRRLLLFSQSPHCLGGTHIVERCEIAPLVDAFVALHRAEGTCGLLLGPVRRTL